MSIIFNSERSKLDDSESDLTLQFDLDSSFKRLLDEKRHMTNKENSPPSAEQSITSTNPPEKPMRRDLLKERKFRLIGTTNQFRYL